MKSLRLGDFNFYSFEIEDYLRSLIQRRYGNDGRLFTAVSAERKFNDDYSVDIAFSIAEDVVRKVKLIEPRGNRITNDDVIRREFALKPGDVFDQRLLDRTMLNLQNTRFFQNIVPRRFPVGDDQVDLMFDLTEGKFGEFSIAMSFNSDMGVVGQLALKYDNFDLFAPKKGFRGGGQRLAMAIDSGSVFKRKKLDFVEPYFLGMPVEFTLNVYDQTETAGRDWDEERTGGRIGFTKRVSLSDFHRRYLKTGLTLERLDVGISNIKTTIDPLHPIWAEEGQYTIASAGLNLRLDCVDNPYLPSKGWRSTLWGEICGKATGGEREFYKYGANFDAFVPLFKDTRGASHVLSFKVRGDWAYAYGDTAIVPLYERYWAGGLTTVRGYDYRSLGPRYPDDPTGTPVYGDFRAIGNVEYLFPLVPQHWIGVLFFDAGNVWARPGDFDPADIRTSIGFGFRIEPMGILPISLFWGRALNAKPGDDLQTFTFSLGTFF